MENATKALLIAAAILIAILIISLSLVVYNMASETVNNINLSETEIAQFNGKFTVYSGTSVSGSQVNALLSTVFTHNNAEKNAQTVRYVKVHDVDQNKDILKNGATTIPKVATTNFYKVTITLNANGLVSVINIDNINVANPT